MRIELDNYSKEVIKRVEEITGTDYERKGNYIEIEKLIAIIEDLEYELHVAEEKLEDREKDIEDNYVQKPFKYEVCDYANI